MAFRETEAFEIAARQIKARLGWVTFTEWLSKSHLWVGLLGLGFVFLARTVWQWRDQEFWIVTGLLALWVLVGIVLAISLRPKSLKALSLFDSAGEWKDQFSSAFFFLKSGESKKAKLSPGEKLHVTRAKRKLPKALKELPQVFPTGSLTKVWILPLVAIVFSLTPFLRKPLNPGDVTLSEEMIQTAAAEADSIRRSSQNLDGLKALAPGERDEIKKLESDIDSVANELASPSEGQTARELLSALESRARAAEKLAERLGLSDENWASEAFVRELSQQADTADLSIGIKEKNPDLVAEQADSIAAILSEETIKRETTDRFTIALERSLSKADEQDRKLPVGEKIGTAATDLRDRNPFAAGESFTALAQHFRRVEQRMEAQKKLERLAAQLRNSGSEISGSKLESLKKIEDTPPSLPDGLKPIEAMPLAPQLENLLAPQIPQPGPADPGTMPMPGQLAKTENQPDGGVPGSGSSPQNGGGSNSPPPIPGESSAGGGEGSEAQGIAQNGSPFGDELGGMLSAPIPGSAQPPGPASGLSGDGAGNSPGPGGGDKAGSSTTDMFEQKDNIGGASKESQVVTQLNEGESEFRTVEGDQIKQEIAKRKRREVMKSFIDVEESALDEQVLPLTRRNQVLRYFSEIRKSLETEE